MLSNGYGCIKKYSKALKQSLFDWMLHKFNVNNDITFFRYLIKAEYYNTNTTLRL